MARAPAGLNPPGKAMQHGVLAFLLWACAAPSVLGGSEQVTALQKVIAMLNGMLVKGREEKQAEAVQFAAYKQFCTDVTGEKQSAIGAAEEEIDILQANTQLAQNTADALAKEIQQLDENIATWDGDIKAANQVRELEKADYVTAHQDYTETIDAIGKATQVLKAQAAPVAQAPASALQVLAQLAKDVQAMGGRTCQARAKAALLAFLASAVDPAESALRDVSEANPGLKSLLQSRKGPEAEAYAYESRSGGVIEMLGKLKDKFVEERSTLEKEELSKRHAHELLIGDFSNSVKNSQNSRSDKAQQRAKLLESVAAMGSQLADTTSTKADDQKYLSDLVATCSKKATDFEARQKMRADELDAIEKALDILQSDKVQQTQATYLSLLEHRRQNATAASLLQVGSVTLNPIQRKAVAYLTSRAQKLGSDVLLAVATRAREDPFAKVKQMIQDLIIKLQEAASEEMAHESWCRAELATNEQVRTDRTTSVERLTSEIEGKNSEIAKLALEITDFTQQLADVTNSIAEMTKLRETEKAHNDQCIKDAQEAQAAVGQALTLLKEYYATAGEATALLQKGGVKRGAKQEPPPIFDETPYQGMAGYSGGVIGILEVIQENFARLESTTQADEATAQNEYNKQMTASQVLKAQLEKDIEHKNALKQQDQEDLVNFNNDLVSVQKELDAADAYFEKLKASCMIDQGMTITERAQRRQEEIESLQEALRILNGEDISVV